MTRHTHPSETRVRRAHLLVTGTALSLSALLYVVVVVARWGQLPDRVAVHFALDGTPDGWMDRPAAVLVSGLVAIGIPALLVALFIAGDWWRGRSSRALSAVVVGLVAALAVLTDLMLWRQAGSAGAQQPLSTVLVALVVGLVAGGVAWALLPPAVPAPRAEAVDALAIAPGDAVSWFGHSRTSAPVLWVLVGCCVLVLGVSVVTGSWWTLLLAVLLVVLVPTLMVYRVRIDRRGLAWRSALGLPRGHVPLEDVTAVSVERVRGGDFGGFGYRLRGGAVGLITDTGPALVVHRDGRQLVITVEDAPVAAGVLEGLRTRGV